MKASWLAALLSLGFLPAFAQTGVMNGECRDLTLEELRYEQRGHYQSEARKQPDSVYSLFVHDYMIHRSGPWLDGLDSATLARFSCLQYLNLRGVLKLETIEAIGRLPLLKMLVLNCPFAPQPTEERQKALWKAICQLKSLESLTINVNRSGLEILAFPASFGALKNLKELHVHGCKQVEFAQQFVDQSPLEVLSLGMDPLGEVEYSRLQRVPPEIVRFRRLRTLSIYRTDVRDLPESLGKLAELESLSLIKNPELAALPHSFGKLRKLQTLAVWESSITELPRNFGRLINLKSLKLQKCLIKALPEALGQLTCLDTFELDASGQSLSALPESFGQLAKLKKLSLKGHSKLTALPESFANLSSLETLYLNGCKLAHLPESFGDLQNLKYADLSKNQLTGLPQSFLNFAGKHRMFYLNGNPLDPERMRAMRRALPMTVEIHWNTLGFR